MRRTRVSAVALACLLNAAAISAQVVAATPSPEVDDLVAPSASALTLLDVSPTAVERPDSPRALVVNLLTHVAKDDGVPKNFGVSVAPYWLRWHPRLTFESYARPSIAQQVARSFAISVASADWKTGQGRNVEDLGSRVSLGVSTVPFQGAMDSKVAEVSRQLTETLADLARALQEREEGETIRSLRAHRRSLQSAMEKAATPEEIVAAWRAFTDADAALTARLAAGDAGQARLDARRKRLAREIQELDTNRYGARLAIAAAWSWAVPSDVFAAAHRDRSAVWITPSYRVRLGGDDAIAGADEGEQEETGDDEEPGGDAVTGLAAGALELVGVARYVREHASALAAVGDAWDLGARVVWQFRSDLALSAEIVGRSWDAADRPDTYRTAGLFEARLGKGAYFFAAFGRDFEQKGTRSTLLSVVGFNLGFGARPALTY